MGSLRSARGYPASIHDDKIPHRPPGGSDDDFEGHWEYFSIPACFCLYRDIS